MTTQQAVELIEQEIRWHEKNGFPHLPAGFAPGFLAGLRQARGVLLSAAMSEANHPEIGRDLMARVAGG